MSSNHVTEVLKFWFEELRSEQWFKVDPEVDAQIRSRFSALHAAVQRGECEDWRKTAEGRLAEVIVLDQFSRNIFRGQAEAFASDSLALVLAQEAVRNGSAAQLKVGQRAFLYMPFMHSESALIHRRAADLFSEPGLEYQLEFEHKHKVIIDRFGRYPHRNEILGRKSTPEEIAFLKTPDSAF